VRRITTPPRSRVGLTRTDTQLESTALIGHQGGEFLAFGDVAPSLRSFGDAIANAYCYDAFVLYVQAHHRARD
jgi:hypothetical protein